MISNLIVPIPRPLLIFLKNDMRTTPLISPSTFTFGATRATGWVNLADPLGNAFSHRSPSVGYRIAMNKPVAQKIGPLRISGVLDPHYARKVARRDRWPQQSPVAAKGWRCRPVRWSTFGLSSTQMCCTGSMTGACLLCEPLFDRVDRLPVDPRPILSTENSTPNLLACWHARVDRWWTE